MTFLMHEYLPYVQQFQHIDLKAWDYLISQCFTSGMVVVDYSSVFGGEPYEIKAKDLMEQWKPRVENLEASQHLLA